MVAGRGAWGMMIVAYFVIATIAGIALPRVVLALTALGTAVLLQTGYFVGGIIWAQLYRHSPSNVNSAHGAHEGRSAHRKTNNH